MIQEQTRFFDQDYILIESVLCQDEMATMAMAHRLANQFSPGNLIALTGDLGAGKTTWVRGLAQSLGLEKAVHSPTYALVHTYGEPPQLNHLDLYRLAPGTDWNELGLEDIFETEAMTCIEWPERMPMGTQFHHWIDIQFPKSTTFENAQKPSVNESPDEVDTRVIRWYRLLDSKQKAITEV